MKKNYNKFYYLIFITKKYYSIIKIRRNFYYKKKLGKNTNIILLNKSYKIEF